jgi:hypothetical protein
MGNGKVAVKGLMPLLSRLAKGRSADGVRADIMMTSSRCFSETLGSGINRTPTQSKTWFT